MKKIVLSPVAVCLLCPLLVVAQDPSGPSKQDAQVKQVGAQNAPSKSTTGAKPAPVTHIAANLDAAPNLAKQPTLYVVAYAHLDTQWRWEYPQVISELGGCGALDQHTLSSNYDKRSTIRKPR